jgi:23S rRNA pseudouridine1911/1915/1917 synthase
MRENQLSYIVKPEDHYVFLREILISQMKISHSLLVKLKLQQKILVNAEPTFTNYRLQAGDLITVDLALEEENNIPPQDIPLDIVYEDQDLLVINKAPGLAVHPVKNIPNGTLANAVTNYWMQQGQSLVFRPINRLDKNTSGLILIGKSQYAHQAIFRQQKKHTMQRHYQAIVQGNVASDNGRIDLPIAHLDPSRSARAVDPSGKPAITNFTVLKRFAGFTLLSLSLETGRTHQIRIHLSQSGYPIVGDFLYGQPSPLIARQALHAGHLTLQHPRSGAPLEFDVPLPPDMLNLLEKLPPLGS